ncbi:hypothetical protein, partial [Cutibacterium avidum]|uniref:hypothetical protein n=1 Tax=Cutibacterium avidum TaxID=33010 RepID=UPI002550C47D
DRRFCVSGPHWRLGPRICRCAVMACAATPWNSTPASDAEPHHGRGALAWSGPDRHPDGLLGRECAQEPRRPADPNLS